MLKKINDNLYACKMCFSTNLYFWSSRLNKLYLSLKCKNGEAPAFRLTLKYILTIDKITILIGNKKNVKEHDYTYI